MIIPQTAEFSLFCTALSLHDMIGQLTEEEKEHRAENNTGMIRCTTQQLDILYQARDQLIRLAAEERHKELASLSGFITDPMRMQ